jgi:radical SAM protein with 4Fe4S-binding SPASM domain
MELPSYIQLEPVGQCNLRCQMCAIQFRQDGPPHGPLAFMDFAQFTRIIDQFTNLRELHLQGLGEPMMHPRFFDMVSYAVNKGIKVTTNSNLTLLNERRAELCVTSGLDCLHVSIDSASAEIYERIRVRAHFDRVVCNLKRLLAVRERLHSNIPRIHLVMVIMRQNLHELPALVRLAHQWSVDQLFVQHLCHDFGESSLPAHYAPMRQFVDQQSLLYEDPERVACYFNQARLLGRELGVDIRLPRPQVHMHPEHTPGPKRCNWPWTGAYISYQGYAMPCCMVSTPDRMNFGNIAEQGAEATWNAPAYQQFRDQLASDSPPEICRSCALYTGTF